jgi:hypothetical protein
MREKAPLRQRRGRSDRGRKEVADLLRPIPADRMEAFPIRPAVNDRATFRLLYPNRRGTMGACRAGRPPPERPPAPGRSSGRPPAI